MRECEEHHEYSDEAWKQASRNRVGHYFQHWHPDTLDEIRNWFITGQDRVRDREFDVVMGIEELGGRGHDTVRIFWANQLDWKPGDPVQDRLYYEVTDDADIERFMLLPVPSASKQDVEDAIASIRRTYQKE